MRTLTPMPTSSFVVAENVSQALLVSVGTVYSLVTALQTVSSLDIDIAPVKVAATPSFDMQLVAGTLSGRRGNPCAFRLWQDGEWGEVVVLPLPVASGEIKDASISPTRDQLVFKVVDNHGHHIVNYTTTMSSLFPGRLSSSATIRSYNAVKYNDLGPHRPAEVAWGPSGDLHTVVGGVNRTLYIKNNDTPIHGIGLNFLKAVGVTPDNQVYYLTGLTNNFACVVKRAEDHKTTFTDDQAYEVDGGVGIAKFSPDASHLLVASLLKPQVHLLRNTPDGLFPVRVFDLSTEVVSIVGRIYELGWLADGMSFTVATSSGVFQLDIDY